MTRFFPTPKRFSPAANRFSLLLLLAFCLRLPFVFLLPLGEKPRGPFWGFNDEHAHFNYVIHIAEERSWPVQTHSVREPGAFERNDFEYYQPPLFYLLAAPFFATGEGIRQGYGLFAVRLFSLFLSLAFLAQVYRLLLRLGAGTNADGSQTPIAESARSPAARRLAEMGTFLLALLPSHVYHSVLVSNDPLIWLLHAHLLYRLLAWIAPEPVSAPGPRAPKWQRPVVLGILTGLSFWTKASSTLLLPLLLLAFLLRALGNPLPSEDRHPSREKASPPFKISLPFAFSLGPQLLPGLRELFLLFALAGAIALPLLLWNLAHYQSLLALNTGSGEPYPFLQSFSPQNLWYLAGWVMRTFWMPFGFKAVVPGLGKAALVSSSLGFLLLLTMGMWALGIKALGSRSVRTGAFGTGVFRESRNISFILLAAQALLHLSGYLFFYGQYRQAEARHFFGALPVLAAVYGVGAARLQGWSWGVTLVLCVLPWAGLFFR